MQSPRRILLLLASMVGAALVGWITAASMAPETRARANRPMQEDQVTSLLKQFQEQDQLTESERVLLLRRLMKHDRLQEAQVVLQPWIEGRSVPMELTLFSAELQRLAGQPEAARHSLQHLLRLHPNHLQVLQLQVLLDQQQGRQRQSIAELERRMKTLEPGQRMEIGLLLADLQRQNGAPQAAANLYRQLAAEEPMNAKPLLALALLEQDQGNPKGAQGLLQQARQRRDTNGSVDPLIDALAGRMGLTAARANISN